MSIFAIAAIGGTGLGPVVGGWIEMNPRLQWRWIQWVHTMCVWRFILRPQRPSSLVSCQHLRSISSFGPDHHERDPVVCFAGTAGEESTQRNRR